MACLGILALFIAPSLANDNYISQDAAIVVVIVALCAGMFVIMGEVEKVFASTLSGFGSAKIFWAIAIAAGGYFARKGALEDVNAVFHIDPSALPMTLLAASVMCFISSLKWVFVGLVVVSVIRSYVNYRNEEFDLMTIGIISAVMAVVSVVFVSAQLHEKGRRDKIYRIAHATDFSGTFRCKDLDEKNYNVLFIGPDQRKILIAPKIQDPVLFAKPMAEIFRPVTIPPDFVVQDCTPFASSSISGRAL